MMALHFITELNALVPPSERLYMREAILDLLRVGMTVRDLENIVADHLSQVAPTSTGSTRM